MSYSGAIWRVTINLKDMLLHGLKRVLKIFIHHNEAYGVLDKAEIYNLL